MSIRAFLFWGFHLSICWEHKLGLVYHNMNIPTRGIGKVSIRNRDVMTFLTPDHLRHLHPNIVWWGNNEHILATLLVSNISNNSCLFFSYLQNQQWFFFWWCSKQCIRLRSTLIRSKVWLNTSISILKAFQYLHSSNTP